MNLETWLSLYKKTGESREEAVDRYIVEQGITDPAEKESIKGQLSTPDPATPAPVDYFDDTPGARYRDEFIGPEFQIDRQPEFMPPSPEEEYIADPDWMDQLGASADTAYAGIYSAIGGQAGGALEDLDQPELASQVRDWAETGRAEQQRQADLVAYPKSSEEILAEDPDSFYKYLPEHVPSGHEFVRGSIPSLTPYAMGLGLTVASTPLLAAAGLTGAGLAIASGLTGMSLTNLASSFYVSGQEYERVRDDPSVREGMGIDPSTRFEDLPSDQKRLLTELRHDMAQTTFGRRLYTAGLVEMLSFARYGGKLFRWGMDMGLGATSEVWDEALYAENAANTMVEYGIPLDVAQRAREKIISLGPSQKKLWTQSLFYEGVYGGGFLAAEAMAGDTRIDGWATSSKKQQEIQEEFQKNRNKIKLKSEEQTLLGTDTKLRQQTARDAVAQESGYKNWEDMEAQEKGIQNAYKFKAGSDAYRARQASEKKVRELEAKAELKSKKEQEDYGRDEVAQMIRAEEQSIRLARGTDFTATRKALEREQEVLDNIRARLPSSTSPVRKDGTLLTSEEIFDINAIKRKRETQLLNLQKRQAALDKAEKDFEKAHPLKTGEQLDRQTKKEARKEVDRPKVQVLKSTIDATTTGEVTTERGVLKRLFDMFQSEHKAKYVILDKSDETRLANIFGGPEYLADAQGHLQGSEGFVHEGIVYLVADNIKGATPSEAINRAVQVGVFHEPIAHLGIRGFLKTDERFDAFLDDFYASNTQDINDWARTEVTPEGVPAYLDEDHDPDLLRKPGLRQRLKLKKKTDTGLSVDKKRELAEEYLAHKFTEYGVRDPHILERVDDSLKTFLSSIVGKKRVSKIQARTMLASIQRDYVGGKRNIITGDFFDPSHWVKSKPLALVEEEKQEETEQTAEEKVEAYKEHLSKGAKADVTPIGTEELLTEDVEEARKAKREAGFVHPNVQGELDRVEANKQARIKAEAKKLKEKKQKAKEKATQEALSILGIRSSKRTMSLRDAQAWAANPENQKGKGRRPRVPELASLAKTLRKGDTTYEEYQDAVDRHLPIEKFEAVPEIATDEEILGSIKTRQYEGGQLLSEANLVDELVDVRLDIPAYERFNTWIATITRSPRKGTPKIYGGTAHLKNVEFKTSVEGALRIAEGDTKGTIATMRGDWQGTSDADIKKLAGVRANKSAWIEIGYNPERQSTFYIKENKGGFTKGTPLASAEEVIQIGGYVLAKRPVTKAVPSKVIDGKTIRFAKLKVKAYGGTAQVEDNVLAALQANPKLAPLIKYMTPQELDLLTTKSADRMVATLEARAPLGIKPGETGFDTEELISMALAGQIHKGWYINSLGAINHVFGADAPRFIGLLSALSPQSKVETSTNEAADLWAAWIKANRPTDKAKIIKIATEAIPRFGGMTTLHGNTVRTLTAKNPKKLILSGPKVQSFYHNLMGNLDEVTHDTWMWNVYGILKDKIGSKIPPSGVSTKMPTYTIASAKLREAADMLTQQTDQTWKPAEVQETIWSFYKALTEFAAKKDRRAGRTLDEIVVQEDLTQRIEEIPDFAKLLDGTAVPLGKGQNYAQKINDTLTKAGYGKQIATLSTQPVLTKAMGGATPTFKVEGIGKVAKRLEAQKPSKIERIRASKKTKQWTEEKKGMSDDGEMRPWELAYLEWSEQWFNYGPGNKPFIVDMENLIGIAKMDYQIHEAILTEDIEQYLPSSTDGPVRPDSNMRTIWTGKKSKEAYEAYRKYIVEWSRESASGGGSGVDGWYTELFKDYDKMFKVFDGKPVPARIESLRRHVEYAQMVPQQILNKPLLRTAVDARMAESVPYEHAYTEDGDYSRDAKEWIQGMDDGDIATITANWQFEVQKEHEEIHKENTAYLNTSLDDDAVGLGTELLFKSAMIRALNLNTGKTDLTPPPEVVGAGRAMAQTFNRFQAGDYTSLRHMHNDFVETSRLHREEALREAKLVGEPVVVLDGGVWGESPMVTAEHMGTDTEEEVYRNWREHAHDSWCWYEQRYERIYAPKGPVFYYEKNGKFLIGLRFEYKGKGDVGMPRTLKALQKGGYERGLVEIQSQQNNNTIPAEMADAVNDFIKAKEAEWGEEIKMGEYSQSGKVLRDATEGMKILKRIQNQFAEKGKWKARNDNTYGRKKYRMYLRELDGGGYAARWEGDLSAGMKVIIPDLIPDQKQFPIEILAEHTNWNVESSRKGAEEHVRIAGGGLSFMGENIRLSILENKTEVLPNLTTVHGELYAGWNSDDLSKAEIEGLFGSEGTKELKAGEKKVIFPKLVSAEALILKNSVDVPHIIAIPGKISLLGNSTASNLESAGKVEIYRGLEGDKNFLDSTVTQGLPKLENVDTSFIYEVQHENVNTDGRGEPLTYAGQLGTHTIDFNKLSSIGEDVILSPQIDTVSYKGTNVTAKALKLKELHSIGGDLLHAQGKDMNPDFPMLYAIAGDSRVAKRYSTSQGERVDWWDRFDDNGYSAPNLTLVGGDLEVYANSYLPNLQRVGKDIHIYIDQRGTHYNLEERDTLADVKELLPNLTHVGGQIIIHMKEDTKFGAKRFLHIGGDISTLSWDKVSDNGYDLNKDYFQSGNVVGRKSREERRLESEKRLAATQDGFVSWSQYIHGTWDYEKSDPDKLDRSATEDIRRKDIERTKADQNSVEEGNRTAITSFQNLAPNLKFIGSNRFNERTRRGREEIHGGESTDATVLDYSQKIQTYWKGKGGRGVESLSDQRAFRNLFGPALKGTDLDPRTRTLIRFSKMVKQTSAKELEAEWRKRRGKPTARLPKEKLPVKAKSKGDKVTLSKEGRAILDAKPTAKDLTHAAILDPKGNVRSSKVLMSRAAKHAIDTRSKSWNPLTRWTGFAQPFADSLTKHLVSQGTLPDSAKYKALRRRVKGIILAGETAGKKVYDALKKSKQKELIFKYLTTKDFDPNQIKDLGERQTAISAKKKINEIGEMLVERKLMKRKTKEQYEGEYLPKVYLKYLLGEDNFRKATAKGGLGLDMSYLIGRKDIPEGIRKLILGEIEDPGYLASKAVSVPQKDIAIIDWLKTIAGNANWVLPSSLIHYDVLGKMKSLTASVDLQKQLELIDTEGSQVSAFWLANEADRIFTQTKLMDLSKAERQIVVDLTEDMKAQAQAQIAETEGKIDPKMYSMVPTTPKYGQLAGMAVRKEIAQDIFGSMSMATGDISLAESVFGDGGKVGDYNRIWKWSKVSANPPSWVRNFVSNLTLMNMGGVPFVRMPDLMLSSLADMRKRGKHKGRLHQLAKDIGLTSGNFSSAELGRIETEFKDLMQRMSAKEKAGMRVLGPIKGAFNVLRDSTSNLYGGIDSLGKMMMLKYNMDKAGLKIKDIGAYSPTDMALLNDAAYDAEKYLFDYSNPLPSVKWLRRAPFGAPFISFTSFALPLVVETAITKPWKFLPYYLLGYSAKELFKSLNDLDEEDYKGLKVSMSDYLREKAEGAGPYPVIPWPYLDENGRIQFIDVSYLYPWGMFSEVLGELFSGDFGKAIRTAGLMGSPAVTTASAIISGVDGFTRQPIVDDFGTWDEQAADIGWFAFNLTMPPMLHGIGQGPGQGYGAVKRMWEAFHGQLNKEGEARFTMPQAVARMSGINITPIAVPEGRNKQLRYEYSRIQKLLRLAKRDMVNMIIMQESKADIQEAAKHYREKIQEMAGKFSERAKTSKPPISLLRQREAALKKMRASLQSRRSG